MKNYEQVKYEQIASNATKNQHIDGLMSKVNDLKLLQIDQEAEQIKTIIHGQIFGTAPESYPYDNSVYSVTNEGAFYC